MRGTEIVAVAAQTPDRWPGGRGDGPGYVYERGQLDTSLPFEELQRRSRINDPARAADRAADFSRRIREGLPRQGGRSVAGT